MTQEVGVELQTESRRALQSLKPNKHLVFLSKLSRLYFQNQLTEQGRSTFETILQNYPRRTDLWSLFIDLEVKYGSQPQVRLILGNGYI